MNSLTQPYLSPSPAPGETRPRYDSATRSQVQARGLKGASYSRRTASPEHTTRQAYGHTAPPREVDREGRARLGGASRTRFSLGRLQGTVDMLHASTETDSPRPHGIFEAFVKTCQRWRLDQYQQAALLGHPPPSTLGTYVLNGNVLSPSMDVRERATRVFEISLGLGTLFDEDPEVENEWLRTPRERFSNAPPLDHMLEGHMDNLVAVAELVHHERGL